jgi:YVTN family beta-propeller protein
MAADTVAGGPGSAEFGILGPLQVSLSGRVVPLGGPRQRAVLALLLLDADRVVSMDRLAEDVWAGRPPREWATTLQTYVFHLRRALEPGRLAGSGGGVLVTSGRGYLLRAGRGQLDAARFEDGFTAGRAALEAGRYAEAAETLRQALDLWRGPVLADLADYAFTRPEAARLEELRLAALEARIDADLALGRHDTVTGELERLAAGHPLRERLHGQLMVALDRCGRQADALTAFRRVRELLADELGIDPGEPLRRVHAAVLAHDPALDWTGDRPAPAGDDRAATPGAWPQEPAAPRPIGRPRELDWARRRARRLLAVGLALAAAAAVGIVVVARPWASGPAGLPADSVGLFNRAGGRVGAPVSVGNPGGLAYGDGSVWAVDSADGTLSRIDPATHTVIDQIPVGSAPTAVTVTRGNAWVANSGDATVWRISTAAGKVVQTIRVGIQPVAIASGPSGVWVANEGDGTVIQINPATGTKMRSVRVGGLPDGIAVTPAAVWVANSQDGTVTQIDPANGHPSGPIPVGAGPEGIAVTPAGVWVANSLDLTVSKLDPATGRQTDVIPVGDGPGTIVAAGNAIWVSDEFGARLDRIDPQSDRVVRVVPLGSSPQGMVAAGAGLWVAARPFAAASHRGGTLTVVSGWMPSEADPARAYNPVETPALATAYDGLVAWRRAAGAQGLTLVPDLARALPRPADGGTTYKFTLRRGIRYSNGALVQASDFRRGLQRQLMFGSGAGYYEGILGAPACGSDPASCDLSAGIVTNDTTGTVTFHLSQPDPDFLYKLALVLAAPAPPGAPGHVIRRAPFLPGTGPYMIARFRPGTSLTLVRNPHFRPWSYAAQPPGYPAVIRYELVTSQTRQVSAVIAGRADLDEIGWGDQSLAIRYPTRVHIGPDLNFDYFFLNTRLPPFNNLKARRAVNYAVDRARIIQLLGFAPKQAAPTCQILPADFPGYQPYCPYTIGTKDGTWHGPDIRKARRLARESRTTNVPVTVWIIKEASANAAGFYVVRLLKDLGYQARLDVVPAGRFFTAAPNARSRTQMGLVGWGFDYPAPSTFFLPLLSCSSLSQGLATSNYSGFCDRDLDNLTNRALAAQLTDSAAARKLWAQADRRATDQAPLIPLFDESAAGFVSAGTGNYQASPEYGPLLDQMWIHNVPSARTRWP